MPNLRTTVIVKKKAYALAEGDLIKVGGRWWVIDRTESAISSPGRRHIHLYPENSDAFPERIAIFADGLQKFKVRTPK